jgi:asparagine synthase (glutamine-hydrolysing)
MCGICGIVQADSRRHVDPSVLRRMSDAIKHRGPDDSGEHLAGSVALAMRRLSIIDVEHGHQPIANEDGTVQTVYNGEIYNYRGLRRELERRGHGFRTDCDTETIVHAYEDDGVAFLSRLRGMFALAIWDERRQKLLLAVDRFGVKPLYYAETAGGLVFGSELGSLLQSGVVGRELDPDGLAQYFTFGYIPAPLTIFRGVRKFAPGQLLVWTRDGGAKESRYWEYPASPPADTAVSREETLRSVRDALRDAVRSHLISDVPIGAFLSGGIDSSAVVALMSEATSQPVKTFSIGFSDPRYSELDKARLVAERFGTDHHELVVEPADLTLLPRIVSHLGEPFSDASALPTYHVSELARRSVKVALSGDGGDELFLGYTIFRGLELSRRLQHLPSGLRSGLAGLPSLIPTTSSPGWNDRAAQLRKRVAASLEAPDAAFRRKISTPGLETVAPFLSEELRVSLRGTDAYAPIDSALAAGTNGHHPLDRYVRAGFAFSLPGDMLVKVDRMSMANSLEVRVPLLDHLLVDAVAAVPVAERFKRWRLKGLFKDAMADVLPQEILKQPKQGFNIPVTAWFRGDVTGFAQEVLTDDAARRRGFLDPDAIGRLVQRHSSGREDLGAVIWSLMIFQLWCSEYLPS